MHMLDEVERSLHDALCAIKRALESASVVPGGGCVESALSIHLENFATSLASREQLAITEPALSKVKMIQFATEAAITVLRIDDMIKLAPEDQQQGGGGGYHGGM